MDDIFEMIGVLVLLALNLALSPVFWLAVIACALLIH